MLLAAVVAIASYDLEARLFPDEKTVRAHGTVTWTNTSERPVNDLWWHLYLNAFRDKSSTFMLESGGRLRKADFVEGNFGSVEVDKLEFEGADLLASRTFEHPDDDNTNDRTVMKTPLPRPVQPGEKISLSITFTSKLPRVFARSGWAPPSFFMVAQWFPKIGVLEKYGWNCHQYHGSGEFFSDFGDYKVAITVPDAFEVGATGKRVGSKKNEGTTTHTYEQKGVHDFAFAADSRFVRRERKFSAAAEVSAAELEEVSTLLGLPPSELVLSDVDVTLLIQPDHLEYEERYHRATANALKWFGLWYGAYPYETLTVIDGPRTASGAMGMEYPTLFTGGVRWPAPEEMPIPESVTVHEFGHQYWYGLVATNEFEESWLDEGFNTYSTGKVLDRAYGKFVYAPPLLDVWLVPWFSELRMSSPEFQWLGAAPNATFDQIVRNSWQYRSSASYRTNSYSRPALALSQLEADIGTSSMARALREYHQRFRFKHPRSEDFVSTVVEVAGPAAEAWARESVHSSRALDYAVAGIENKDTGSTVTLLRKGEAVHAIRAVVTFEDGREETYDWDGEYRHQKLRFPAGTKVKSARIITPLLFDLDPTNNSRHAGATIKPGLAIGATAHYLAETLFGLLGGLL
jgi:hypothetical protein